MIPVYSINKTQTSIIKKNNLSIVILDDLQD